MPTKIVEGRMRYFTAVTRVLYSSRQMGREQALDVERVIVSGNEIAHALKGRDRIKLLTFLHALQFRPTHKRAWQLWPDIRAALDDLRMRGRTVEDASPTTDELVKAEIERLVREGVDLRRITRDALAKTIGKSGGIVSKTEAWHTLRAHKRASASPDEAVMQAATRGDWRQVRQIQDREQCRVPRRRRS